MSVYLKKIKKCKLCFFLANMNTTEFGYEGDTVNLICPLRLLNGTTTKWKGPPSLEIYFINDKKNPAIDRMERFSVVKNHMLIYDLHITNFTKGVDNGTYICDINSKPFQEHQIVLKFYSKYKVFDFLLASPRQMGF